MIGLLVVLTGLLLAWPARPRGSRRPVGVDRPTAPRRDGPSGVLTLRRVALGAAVVALTVGVSPLLGLGLVGAIGAWPRWTAHQEVRRRRAAVVDALPEAADLLALAVAGGSTVSAAVATAARWAPGPVGVALRRAGDEIGLGRPSADALEAVAADLGPPSRPLVGVLLASERYGAPLGESLDRLAREARLERRRRAEERARRVPVLLLFPLVLCVLPAFGLLTVVPLLVGALPDLPP